MLSTRLFLGFPIDSAIASNLAKINPEIVSLFIKQEGGYLTEITYLNQLYLGKYVEGTTNLPQLELLETHIYSVLKKIIPDYPHLEISLALLPVVI